MLEETRAKQEHTKSKESIFPRVETKFSSGGNRHLLLWKEILEGKKKVSTLE